MGILSQSVEVIEQSCKQSWKGCKFSELGAPNKLGRCVLTWILPRDPSRRPGGEASERDPPLVPPHHLMPLELSKKWKSGSVVIKIQGGKNLRDMHRILCRAGIRS